MKIINSIQEMQAWAEEQRKQGKSLGFVPTMGYLHEGHLSLVRKSVQENNLTVVSIFVNPLQFAPHEDLEKYPRDFQRDEKLCRQEKVDVIFYPSEQEMYQDNLTAVAVEKITRVLCGQSRPTHFKGVTTVCLKLFNIVKPHQTYFGLKDFQQYVVIKKMVRDLNLDLEIVPCPIVREADGLALSSRNEYLSPAERKQAVILFKSLNKAKELFDQGETEAKKIKQEMRNLIAGQPLAKIDYVSIVNPSSLKEVEKVSCGDVALVAAFLGKVRLIDNLVLE